MPRIARIVLPGFPHHITQRGNNRQDVFFTTDDRRRYLELLKEERSNYGLTILGYCLMTNHVHLVAVPQNPDSLAKAVGRAHLSYTQYVNRLHGRSGHLWQSRFYSCALDEDHVLAAMRYVERNPVRAGLVGRAWDFPWSSAAAHVGATEGDELIDMSRWAELTTPRGWQALLDDPVGRAELSNVRANTRTGRPLASDTLLSKLEAVVGRRLRPLPRGRPKK